MTDDPTTTLAAEMSRHEPTGDFDYVKNEATGRIDGYLITCTCGDQYVTEEGSTGWGRSLAWEQAAREHLAAHQLAVLAEEGWQIMRTPEDACARHREPQGPNEDIAGFCTKCGRGMFSMRPEGETFGNHLPDCSLPLRHESYCVGGGSGHAPSRKVRG